MFGVCYSHFGFWNKKEEASDFGAPSNILFDLCSACFHLFRLHGIEFISAGRFVEAIDLLQIVRTVTAENPGINIGVTGIEHRAIASGVLIIQN